MKPSATANDVGGDVHTTSRGEAVLGRREGARRHAPRLPGGAGAALPETHQHTSNAPNLSLLPSAIAVAVAVAVAGLGSVGAVAVSSLNSHPQHRSPTTWQVLSALFGAPQGSGDEEGSEGSTHRPAAAAPASRRPSAAAAVPGRRPPAPCASGASRL